MSEKQANLLAMQNDINALIEERQDLLDKGDNAKAEEKFQEIVRLRRLMLETEAVLRSTPPEPIIKDNGLVDKAFGYPDVQDYDSSRGYF